MKNIRELLRELDARDELHEVETPVEADLEIAAVTERVAKGAGGGKALFFSKVTGYRWPVVTNLFGSSRRMALALGVGSLEDLGARMAAGLARHERRGADEALRRLISEPVNRPRTVVDAPCRQRRADDGLGALPALRSWAGENGRFLTLPLVHTRHPQTGEVNCGMYRAQVVDPDRLTLNWSKGSDGARHHDAWERRGEAMPVAISLGGPPAAILAAAMPLPAGIDEMAMAGFLAGTPVALAPAGETGLFVPAEAEIVIEGVVEPGETALEGPFGNHTGFYSEAKRCPVMRVTAVRHRRDPVYPCTVVGPPPMEDCYLARAGERLFLPLWQRMFPLLADIHLPFEGIFHGCALVAVRHGEPGRGAALIRDMWRSAAFGRSRLLVAIDESVDIRSASEVFWRAVNRVAPQRDVLVEGERIGIDATGSLPGRGGEVRTDDAVRELVSRRWRDYGFDE